MKFKIILTGAILITSFSLWGAGKAEVDVSLTPAGDFKAKTSDVIGEAKAQGDKIIAENIVVKLNNLKTGIALRDKHAREKYLEVAKYPTITLVKAEGKKGKGVGKIQYRGVERDIAGTYTVSGNRLKAQFPMKLSDFNIKGIKYMGVGVDDEIKVNIDVPLKK